MKKMKFALMLLAMLASSIAWGEESQVVTTATTKDGRAIVLFKDTTWQYASIKATPENLYTSSYKLEGWAGLGSEGSASHEGEKAIWKVVSMTKLQNGYYFATLYGDLSRKLMIDVSGVDVTLNLMDIAIVKGTFVDVEDSGAGGDLPLMKATSIKVIGTEN